MPEVNEIAVDIQVQQKAALYGIAATLVGTGKVPNKKGMKKIVKRLRKDVVSAIGADGAEELLMQNRGAVEMVLIGVRKDPKYQPKDRKKLISALIESWHSSYVTGLGKLQWQTDGSM